MYIHLLNKQTNKYYNLLFSHWCAKVAAALAGVRQVPSHISPKPVVFLLTFPVIKNIS